MVGIAEHKGDSLTFLVLDSVTSQVVAELRSDINDTAPNLSTLMASDGSTPASRKTIKSHMNAIDFEIPTLSLKLPCFSPAELLDKTFVRTLDDDKTIVLLSCEKSRIMILRTIIALNFLLNLVMVHLTR
jgi:hypothetical protein